jgi:hypothetical protein
MVPNGSRGQLQIAQNLSRIGPRLTKQVRDALCPFNSPEASEDDQPPPLFSK